MTHVLHRSFFTAPSVVARSLLLLLVLLGGCASGGVVGGELRAAADAEIARRPQDYVNGEARAWLVRKDGTDRGLLWGTMHIGYSGDTVMPRPIRERFSGAADLSVEVVIDRLSRRESAKLRALFREANEKADRAALDRLDPQTKTALNQAGLPDGSTMHYSLRGLATLVSAVATAETPGNLPVIGYVDLNLIGFARSQGRTVLGLESLQTPDPTLLDPNGRDAADVLRLNLRRADALREMSAWVRAAYGQGDVAHLLGALIAWRAGPDDLARSDRDRAALLHDRNLAWLPRLETTFAKPGEHFIAVGAAHLPGEDGLVALLRGRGYEVRPCPGDRC